MVRRDPSVSGPAVAEPILKRHVMLVRHSPVWMRSYRAEGRRWAGMLGDNLLTIHHIGSTAVPGIRAKPIVDILAVVRSHKRLDWMAPALAARGYQAKGENGIPGRRYFQKNVRGERAFHVHAYERGHPEIETHLLFRDHLRANRADALAYDRLKARLAKRYRNDKKRYGLGKDAFIRRIVAKARARKTVTLPVTVRRFRPGDARAVSSLICRTYARFCSAEGTPEAVRHYVESYSPKGKSTADLCRRFARTPLCFVALAKGTPVGVVRGIGNRVVNLFVDRHFQRRRIATSLMRRYEHACRAAGHLKIVARASLHGVPFYRSIGFVRTTGVRSLHGLKVQPVRKSMV